MNPENIKLKEQAKKKLSKYSKEKLQQKINKGLLIGISLTVAEELILEKKIMEEEFIFIEQKYSIIRLKIEPFDTDVDVDDLVQIHSYNVTGEIYTSPALLNKVGVFKAEIENQLALKKLDFEIFFAKLKMEKRKQLTVKTTDAKGKDKIEKPVLEEIEYAAVTDPTYRKEKEALILLERNLKIAENFYWSVKSKDDKLTKITDKIRPEEFEKELVEERINTVQIKKLKKVLK